MTPLHRLLDGVLALPPRGVRAVLANTLPPGTPFRETRRVRIVGGVVPEGTVYVGRPGKGLAGPFGNPYALGRCARCGRDHTTRGSTLLCYQAYLEERLDTDADFRAAVLGLQGQLLACFCERPHFCHASILARAVDRLWLAQLLESL